MEYVRLTSPQRYIAKKVAMRCPYCGNDGTFDPFDNDSDVGTNGLNTYSTRKFGHRRCPNPKCYAHVFCLLNANDELLEIVPSRRIDFNKENIPPTIIATLTEAITCHSEGCHKAAAMMVRRTLEELCELHSAKGDNLKKRIGALRNLVTLPKPLLDGLDDLRLLGNDAAHIEAKVFENIGANEVHLAIDVTKEVLKAIYQYDALIGRLAELKKRSKKPE